MTIAPTTLPQTVSIDPLDRPEYETNFNVSVYYRSGSFKVRLRKVPGQSSPGSSKGFHEIQASLHRMWQDVQNASPHIGEVGFATVPDMKDPTTGTPTVGIVSPFYEKGYVLEQENTTRKQKRDWSLQICEAINYLHSNGIVHANVHPRNILIRDDGSAVLTDACLYSLIVEHIIDRLSDEIRAKVGHPETIACRTTTSVKECGGEIPATTATKDDDIFGLAISIWMIFQGKEPWPKKQAIRRITEHAHQNLKRPDDMSDGLWRILHALISWSNTNLPTVKEIQKELELII